LYELLIALHSKGRWGVAIARIDLVEALFWKRVQTRWAQPASLHAR